MKFETSLGTPDRIVATSQEKKEEVLKEGFTCVDVTTIVGIEMQEGGAVLISRESWKRLELFMALLSGVEMSISQETIKDILKEK